MAITSGGCYTRYHNAGSAIMPYIGGYINFTAQSDTAFYYRGVLTVKDENGNVVGTVYSAATKSTLSKGSSVQFVFYGVKVSYTKLATSNQDMYYVYANVEWSTTGSSNWGASSFSDYDCGSTGVLFNYVSGYYDTIDYDIEARSITISTTWSYKTRNNDQGAYPTYFRVQYLYRLYETTTLLGTEYYPNSTGTAPSSVDTYYKFNTTGSNACTISGLSPGTKYVVTTRLEYKTPAVDSDWNVYEYVSKTFTTPSESSESCVNMYDKLTLSSTSSGVVTYTVTSTATNATATRDSLWSTRLDYKTSSGGSGSVIVTVTIPSGKSTGTYTGTISGLTPGDTFSATIGNDPQLGGYNTFIDSSGNTIIPTGSAYVTNSSNGTVTCTVYKSSSGGGGSGGGGTTTTVLKWSWTDASGSWNASKGSSTVTATALQTAYNAASNKGATTNVTVAVWNDLTLWVKYVNTSLSAGYSGGYGYMSSNILTASLYNEIVSAVNAILTKKGSSSAKLSTVSSGDTVYGTHILQIPTKVNGVL